MKTCNPALASRSASTAPKTQLLTGPCELYLAVGVGDCCGKEEWNWGPTDIPLPRSPCSTVPQDEPDRWCSGGAVHSACTDTNPVESSAESSLWPSPRTDDVECVGQDSGCVTLCLQYPLPAQCKVVRYSTKVPAAPAITTFVGFCFTAVTSVLAIKSRNVRQCPGHSAPLLPHPSPLGQGVPARQRSPHAHSPQPAPFR